MTTQLKVVLTAAVVGLAGQVCVEAQTIASATPAMRLPVRQHDAVAIGADSGSIASTVRDVNGLPVPGAIVSAVGGRTVTAMTDARGRCTLPALPAGEYLVRVHRSGFTVGNSLIVKVGAGDIAAHTVVLTPLGQDGAAADARRRPGAGGHRRHRRRRRSGRGSRPRRDRVAPAPRQAQRAARRGRTGGRRAPTTPAPAEGGTFSVSSPLPASASLFGTAPLTGQVNLLTTSTFDSPEQLLSDVNFARGIAYVSLGAAAGTRGDWSMQAAMTQGDVASWVFAGSFVGRPIAGHRYQAGLSYATQRYTGANPAAVAAVEEGTRNSGAIYGYDAWTLSRRAIVLYGARFARYGYVDGALFSPRVEVTLDAVRSLREAAAQARRGAARRGAGRRRVRRRRDRQHVGAARAHVRAAHRHGVRAGAHAHLPGHRRARRRARPRWCRSARSTSAPGTRPPRSSASDGPIAAPSRTSITTSCPTPAISWRAAGP